MIRPVRSLCVLLAAASVLAGCGSAATPTAAPTLTVVTGLSPLAQLAGEVGGTRVRVVDVVPDGADPRAATLDAAAVAAVRNAAVVLVVGGGYQPALESAAAGARRVLALSPTYGAPGDGPWLVPSVMRRWAAALGSMLGAADPAGRSAYANGSRDVAAEMSSLSADFQNSLSDCPRKTIVTPDTTWSGIGRAVGLTDRAVGTFATPDAVALQGAVQAIRSAGAKTVFSEPWVPDGTVRAAAAVAGSKLRPLDTLTGAPVGGWPRGATYARLMEKQLAVLTSSLQCAQMGQS